MKDIQNREDIIFLIDHFYKRVIGDDLIGTFFTEVVVLDWDIHIPIMYDFWDTTLLGAQTYKGNPMVKHLELNMKKALTSQHFDRWLLLWKETITKNFEGAKAEEAITRATQIGALMQHKIAQHTK